MQLQKKMTLTMLNELLDYILKQQSSVDILNATNSTLEHWKTVMNHIHSDDNLAAKLSSLRLHNSNLDSDYVSNDQLTDHDESANMLRSLTNTDQLSGNSESRETRPVNDEFRSFNVSWKVFISFKTSSLFMTFELFAKAYQTEAITESYQNCQARRQYLQCERIQV